MKVAYSAKLEADEDGRILVTFRDFPEAATDGADKAEALREASDLLDSTLMFRMKYREDIPAPSRVRKGEVLVVPDTSVALKAALYMSMRERGMNLADLSRALKVDYKEVQRILNPKHATKTARMSEAIEATGRHAIIELQTA